MPLGTVVTLVKMIGIWFPSLNPMSSMLPPISADIRFDEAINLTQEFLTQLKDNKLAASEIQDFVTKLVATSNGARGFFVTYLTAPDPICDEPRSEIVAALGTHPEITTDLLVKNIAMSTAQQLYHQRREDSDMAASSATVAARTIKIVQQLNLPQIQIMCRDLVDTINNGNGTYSDFLTRWGYDDEQKQSIAQVVTQVLAG
jgi:hypothetical protein